MSTSTLVPRRHLLSSLSCTLAFARTAPLLFSGPALLAVSAQTAAALPEFSTLSIAEASEFAAIAARIVPSDATPGASEAGVIHFIDKVLGSSRSELLAPLRAGLAELQQRTQGLHGSVLFSSLDAAQQDSLLQAIETTAFFSSLRTLTLAGLFALPEYGGNRDHVGWDLIGFDHRHVWQPPFGYYDADYAQRGE